MTDATDEIALSPDATPEARDDTLDLAAQASRSTQPPYPLDDLIVRIQEYAEHCSSANIANSQTISALKCQNERDKQVIKEYQRQVERYRQEIESYTKKIEGYTREIEGFKEQSTRLQVQAQRATSDLTEERKRHKETASRLDDAKIEQSRTKALVDKSTAQATREARSRIDQNRSAVTSMLDSIAVIIQEYKARLQQSDHTNEYPVYESGSWVQTAHDSATSAAC